MLRRSVEDDVAPVRPVHVGDLGTQLALEPLHPRPRPVQLVLQAQDVLDAREVQAELAREPLHEAQQ